MTQQYDNRNKGAIWPNAKMREDKQDPHFTGSLNVDGNEYWVSAWKRKPGAKQGSPSLTFAVNRKDQNKIPNPAKPEPTAPPEDSFDDDIPF